MAASWRSTSTRCAGAESASGPVIFSSPTIHDAIIEDLYQAAQVLMHRKYRLLRLSYLALMVGMVATLVAVLVEA
jgi:hypothetical protein